jgi:NAD(P)-dependent dehydrogenase (short-subunit alcohol dehydrogenase family)
VNAEKKLVVVITGAAGNLGRAAAQAFGRRGARLVLIDISLDHLTKAYPTPSPDQLLLALDLTDEVAVQKAVAGVMQKNPRIDVLCNIAGGFYYGEPVYQMRQDVWTRQIELNAGTVINAIKAVVPGMIAAASGTVINIGAAGHVQGHGHMSAYAASKGAVMRLTESMAEELQGSGVRVFCLMPTTIDTPENRAQMPQADFSSWTPAEDIAEVMSLLTADAAALMSGCLIPLKGKVRRRRAD